MTFRMNDNDHKCTHFAFQYVKRNIRRALKKQGLQDVSDDEVSETIDKLFECLDVEGEYRQALMLTLISEIIFNNVWRVEERDGPDPIEQMLKHKAPSRLEH